MAKDLGGKRLGNVVDVKTARDQPEDRGAPDWHVRGRRGPRRLHGMPHAPRASFWAAGLAQIVTRPLDDARPLLRQRGRRLPAALARAFRLFPPTPSATSSRARASNADWDDPNCRSSFVGQFAL